MKLRYKKIILLTSLSTMGIGLLTLSISQGNPKAENNINTTSGIVADAQVNDDSDDITAMSAMESAPEVTEEAEVTPVPTLTPTPVRHNTDSVCPLDGGLDAFIEVFHS